jgi:hypothetical protein
MLRNFYILLIHLLFVHLSVQSQILINEISGKGGFNDEDGDDVDWIELYNAGASVVNLENYGLSDDSTQTGKWKLPSVSLVAGEFLLVAASGKDRRYTIDHWETVVQPDQTWHYFVGISEPNSGWAQLGVGAGWFRLWRRRRQHDYSQYAFRLSKKRIYD